ncbi:MAG: 2Fe-2S iron-sulfur cluster binding domain-containing protein [Nitrospirae bacterium]|nr:MAG: 2Fe-2S iron-sulfur cluster binding domain-containing protein [Nitrospirota bacterium]
MSKTVNLKIDNKEVQVPEGTNLIDAAATAGIHIPNLCHMKGMKGIGACRLCLVELEGMKSPMIACTTRVREGMVVNTQTEKVREIRKFVIDLILSMHPLDCMTCTKAGVCNLQQYAYDFELKESTFTRKRFDFAVDNANPFIKRDPDYCVLCGRCVRICKAQGTNVLEFSGRGVGSKVVTANDAPLQNSGCTFCGSCVDVCPVNALLEADRWRKGREWEYEHTASVCLSCGNACSISVSTKDGLVSKVNAGAPEGSLQRYICAIGRFGFDSVYGELRVRTPMKRVGDALTETTWEDALALAAGKLKSAGSEASVLSSGNILNEDAFLLKKLAADVIKTKNVDSSVSLYADYDSMKAGAAELETADLFVLAGLAADQWDRVLPAVHALIGKKMHNDGAKLIVINSGDIKIAQSAAVVLKGDEVKMIEELAQAAISKGVKAPKEMVSALAHVDPSDQAMEAADLFMASKSPVILSAPSLFKAAANLTLIKGEAVAVPFEANARGIVAMGLTSEGKKFREMATSSSPVLYAIGDVPVDKRPDTGFLIVQTSLMTDLALQADLLLPAAHPLETSGSIIDYLGTLKETRKVVDPSGGARTNVDIFVALAEAMGGALKMPKDTDIRKAAKTKAKISFSPFKRDQNLDNNAGQLIEQSTRQTVNCSRLLWLKETEKAALV